MTYVVIRCYNVPVMGGEGVGPSLEPVADEIIGPFETENEAAMFVRAAPNAMHSGALRVMPVSDPTGWTMPEWCPSCRDPAPDDILNCKHCGNGFCEDCGSAPEGYCGPCGKRLADGTL